MDLVWRDLSWVSRLALVSYGIVATVLALGLLWVAFGYKLKG